MATHGLVHAFAGGGFAGGGGGVGKSEAGGGPGGDGPAEPLVYDGAPTPRPSAADKPGPDSLFVEATTPDPSAADKPGPDVPFVATTPDPSAADKPGPDVPFVALPSASFRFVADAVLADSSSEADSAMDFSSAAFLAWALRSFWRRRLSFLAWALSWSFSLASACFACIRSCAHARVASESTGICIVMGKEAE